MLVSVLRLSGRLLAGLPEPFLKAVTVILGEGVLWLAPRRRRLILSNLEHAFPDRTASWRQAMARQCSRHLIETGLLSLATPHLPEKRIRRMARLMPSVREWIGKKYGAGAAAAGPSGSTVLATLHLALWESQTWLKLLSPVALPEFGIIFRPLENPAIDAEVKASRERFGMRLLSRKQGFADALRILRAGGCVGVLFDQNAGPNGALTLLFDRICSTTELPGVLAAKFGSEVRTFYPRRTGFWRVEFESDPIPHDGTPAGITLALNRWLESALSRDELCPLWLWAHDRWRHQDIPTQRLRLESPRNLLEAERRARGDTALPRRTRIWVRLPNWLGDAVMSIPFLRALRAGRPDAEIHLVGRAALLPLFEQHSLGDAYHPLPPRSAGYFRSFFGLRRRFPDVWLLFTNSIRGDLEAWLSRCPQRFGIVRPGRPRPLLSHAYRLPADFDPTQHHQIELWEKFLRHFGLRAPIDRQPLGGVIGASPGHPYRPAADGSPIGLIAGSENEPAKRWPVRHWQSLIAAFPGSAFVLFGTAADRPVTAEIASGVPGAEIEDLAGKTDLAGYAERLRSCRLLVSNDTGGMHLANALGVPVIGLFGPTNPLRTGPIFQAPHRILQPPGCPRSGGGRLSALAPDTVIAAVRDLSPADTCRSSR